MGDIITDTNEMQRSLTDYYNQHRKKLDNLEEMEKILENYNLQRINHEEIENLIRPITNKGNQILNKKNPYQRNVWIPMSSLLLFYIFKKLIQFVKLFKKFKADRTL